MSVHDRFEIFVPKVESDPSVAEVGEDNGGYAGKVAAAHAATG